MTYTVDEFLDGRVTLFGGDNRVVLIDAPDNSIDAVLTDGPYALVSIVKRFGGANAAPAKGNEAFMRASKGFMGKSWDSGEVVNDYKFWAECLRVLKPGGHLLSFGGTRTYHRMACAVEDAGFEIRDMIQWLYGQGFPKSHNISAHDTFCQCNAESSSECSLRSMQCDDVSETVNLSDKRGEVLQSELSQQGAHGPMLRTESTKGAPPIKEPGMERRGNVPSSQGQLRVGEIRSLSTGLEINGTGGRLHNGASSSDGSKSKADVDSDGMRTPSGSQAAKQRSKQSGTVAVQPESQISGAWENCGRCGKPIVLDGLGTALKPANEPIVLARKPLSEKTVAANVLKWGTGAINIDGCRVGTEAHSYTPRLTSNTNLNDDGWNKIGEKQESVTAIGRFPANVILDGSDEVVAAFPKTTTNAKTKAGYADKEGTSFTMPVDSGRTYGSDSGSAARFFYQAKANKTDRANSKHPTVKPIALMRYLARLITPPGGTILDPFAGSGTTGEAAYLEGFNCYLIEREDEYRKDISARFAALAAPANDNEPQRVAA
jgi:DNA modification methylase